MTLHADPSLDPALDPAVDAGPEALDQLSDITLVTRVRAGDLDAYSTLTARHIDAVETLAVALGGELRRTSLVAETFARARRAIEGAEGPGLSVRTWLLRLTLFEYAARTVPTSHHPHVAAFDALPAAWQVALWHLAVEGEAAEAVALSLGATPAEVLGTARGAVAQIRRSVLRAHRPADPTSTCADLHDRFGTEHDQPLSSAELRRAEKHGDVCSTCAALLIDLESVATGLRDNLAHGVLGGAAGTVYLASRPKPLYDLAPPVAPLLAGLRRASASKLRPVMAGVAAVGVAAAAAAVLLGQPATNPGEVYDADGQLIEIRPTGPSDQGVVGESAIRLTSVESTPSDGLPLDRPANPDRAPIESTPAPTPASGQSSGKGSGTGSDGQNGGLPGTDPLLPDNPVTGGSGSGGSGSSDDSGGSGGGTAPAPVKVEVSGSGVKVETSVAKTEVPLPEAPVVTEVVDEVGGVVDEVGDSLGSLL
ncbi:MAG: hypothetical protein Q8Q02_09800 [Nocardioides sp.]|nr:hypothetical protein [Nocardioides sp.]